MRALGVIVGLLQVLPSVHLYHQLTLRADEVYKILTNGLLTTELVTHELPVSENGPQSTLCVSGLSPQASRS